MPQARFQLTTRRVGPLPLINHILSRLRFEEVLAARLGGRVPVEDALRLSVVLKNLLIAREPIYGLPDWSHRWHSELLAPPSGLSSRLSDDAVARALDKLFDADREGLRLEVVARAKRAFRLDLTELHNDTTTVTFSGDYAAADGRRVRGKATLVMTFGHNKDHRKDLKQLVWSLTVCRDGAVPVHYRVFDGNTNDSPTHKEVWEALVEVVGRPDFLYVGDSKLCAGHTLRHIHAREGRFLTVLPRTRREDGLFRRWIQLNEPKWVEVARERPNGGVPDIRYMIESPVPAADGFRLVWVYSTRMAQEDQAVREGMIQQAVERVEELRGRLRNPRTGYRDPARVAAAAEKAVGARAARWLEVKVLTLEEVGYKQARRGRPGKGTPYVRTVRKRFDVVWTPRKSNLDFDTRTDGMFPLLTNTDLPLGELLEAYRLQPRLEKRHEQLKSVYVVAPMFLKKPERVEALLGLYFYALLVEALLEREVRRAMKARKIKSLPLYPEGRACDAPTTDRIFRWFEDERVHRLVEGGRVVQVFAPRLSPLQRHLLELLGIAPEAYTELT